MGEEEMADNGPSTSSGPAASLEAFHGSGADLAASLQTTSLDGLRGALSEVRRLTSLNGHSERPSASDRRIQLAREFCEAGAVRPHQESQRGVLSAWDLLDSQEHLALLPLPLFVLSNLIALLGAHQPTHELADEVIQRLLPSSPASNGEATSGQARPSSIYWTRLQTYLSAASSKNDLSVKEKGPKFRASSEVVILATVRLLLEMSTFAGGKHARRVFDSMNWTMKVRVSNGDDFAFLTKL